MIEKPKFVYTGSKEIYDIKYYNGQIIAKTESRDRFICIICFDNHRVEAICNDFKQIINLTKRNLEAKTIKGQRTYAQGKAYIYLINKITNKEFLAISIIKNEKRYYEPVDRFIHEK